MFKGSKVGVVALLLVVQLGCSPDREAHVGVQEQPANAVLSPQSAGESSSEAGLDREPPVVRLARQLPSDFPLPEAAEIRISRAHEQAGKQEVFMLFEATEGLETTTERFVDYLSSRINGEALQWQYDAGNAWLEIDDPKRGEAWSLIGRQLEGADEGGEEWVVNWWEL